MEKRKKVEEFLALAREMDLALVPIDPREKRAAIPWKRINEGNPYTDKELRECWHDDWGPGFVLGAPSQNKVALDADNAAGVKWCEERITTPMKTVTRKGKHFYIQAPGPTATRIDILNSKAQWRHRLKTEFNIDITAHIRPEMTGEEMAAEQARAEEAYKLGYKTLEMGPVIDIKGDKSLVVGPGAVHPSGFVYGQESPWSRDMLEHLPVVNVEELFKGLRWEKPRVKAKGQSPEEKKRERVLKKVWDLTPETRRRRAQAWLDATPGSIEGMRGDDHLYYVAKRIVCGFLIDPDEAMEMMWEWNPRACMPPWEYSRIQHKCRQADATRGDDDGFMLVEKPKSPPPDPGILTEDGGEKTEGDDGGTNWTLKWNKVGVNFSEIEGGETKNLFVKQFRYGSWRIPFDNPNNIAILLMRSRFFAHLNIRWNELKMLPEYGGQVVDRLVESEMAAWINTVVQDNVPMVAVRQALNIISHRRPYEPVRDWLLSLPPWDGVPRIERMPRDYFGSPDNPLYGTMMRHFVTGLVARTMKPGCKVDTILFLVGSQGRKKSQFFRYLIDGHGDGQWFSDASFKLDEKDGMMIVGTNAIVEWSEGEHAKTVKSINAVKGFLSRQTDEFRAPYDARTVKRPRRCVFAGTSNDKELLHDATGNRRFYIIPVEKDVPPETVARDRAQLMAEGLALYRRFEASEPGSDDYEATRWWMTREEDVERARLMVDYQATSVWLDDVANWIEDRKSLPDPRFTIGMLLEECVGLSREKHTKALEDEIRRTLMALGAQRLGQFRVGGKMGRWWAPDDDRDQD